MLTFIIFSVATLAAFAKAQEDTGSTTIAVPLPDQSSDTSANGSDQQDSGYLSDFPVESFIPDGSDVATSIQSTEELDATATSYQAGSDSTETSVAEDSSLVVETVTEATVTGSEETGDTTVPSVITSEESSSVGQIDVSGASSVRGSFYCGAIAIVAFSAICL